MPVEPGGEQGKSTVDELKEQWEAEDVAADAVAERVTTDEPAQTPADHIESDEPESDTKFVVMDTRSGDTLEISGFAYETIKTINSVIPSRLAFYLGIGALIVIEVVEPPVVAAVALGYEALRAWRPEPRTKTQPRTDLDEL